MASASRVKPSHEVLQPPGARRAGRSLRCGQGRRASALASARRGPRPLRVGRAELSSVRLCPMRRGGKLEAENPLLS